MLILAEGGGSRRFLLRHLQEVVKVVLRGLLLLLRVARLLLLRLLVKLVKVGEQGLLLVRHCSFALLVLRTVITLLARPLHKPVHAWRSPSSLEARQIHLSWLLASALRCRLRRLATLHASILLLIRAVSTTLVELLLLRLSGFGLIAWLRRLATLVELLLLGLCRPVELLLMVLGCLLDRVRVLWVS